jgi:hypothetical protein
VPSSPDCTSLSFFSNGEPSSDDNKRFFTGFALTCMRTAYWKQAVAEYIKNGKEGISILPVYMPHDLKSVNDPAMREAAR